MEFNFPIFSILFLRFLFNLYFRGFSFKKHIMGFDFLCSLATFSFIQSSLSFTVSVLLIYIRLNLPYYLISIYFFYAIFSLFFQLTNCIFFQYSIFSSCQVGIFIFYYAFGGYMKRINVSPFAYKADIIEFFCQQVMQEYYNTYMFQMLTHYMLLFLYFNFTYKAPKEVC